MKTQYLLVTLLAVMLTACKKSENIAPKASANEISMVQKAQILKNSQGDSIAVTYFAEGEMVAVKIKKNAGAEQKLSAKGTSENGEPFFGNGTYTWEMMEDGHSGKLTDQTGNTIIYK